jgi:Domain of unknown function (DUF6456)
MATKVRPTKARRRHGQVVKMFVEVADDAGHIVEVAQVHRDLHQAPLDRYHARGELDPHNRERNGILFKAGEMLRADWFHAGLEPRAVANLLGTGGGLSGYGMAASEAQLVARQAFRRAVDAVGRRLAPILVHVCCEDRVASDYAIQHGARGSQASLIGVTTLRIALEALADHYGLL